MKLLRTHLMFAALSVVAATFAAHPAHAASLQDCNYTESAQVQSNGSILFTFTPAQTATGVKLVYSVGAVSYTVPMSQSASAWGASVSGFDTNAAVTYYFTYAYGGATHQTDLFHVTYTIVVNPMPQGISRGMWIWNSSAVIAAGGQASALIAQAAAANVTDFYLYVSPTAYSSEKALLQTFIAAATLANIRVWGLDGARTYFHDAKGPAPLYQGITNLINYNESVPANQRFFGFQADVEPQDDAGYTTFHSGIPDASLSTKAGSGVWQSTQAQDREMLMRDWLTIHQTAQAMLHAVGLRFGAAMPFWTSSYYGAEVDVSFPTAGDTRQCVMKYMMLMVDDYIVMSYNTSPSNAASRVVAQAAYASTLPASVQPRVYASVETTKGVGTNISYGDTAGKNSKAVVLADMQTITNTLSKYPAFHGMSIEQWSAWNVLPQ